MTFDDLVDQGGRVWGPDAFAWIWDSLGGPSVNLLELDDDSLQIVDVLQEGDGWLPPSFVQDLAASGRSKTGLTRWLLILDAAYEGLGLTRLPNGEARHLTPAANALWHFYVQHRTLCRSADGLIVPKGGYASHGLTGLIANLHRVPPALAKNIRPIPVMSTTATPTDGLELAFVVALKSASDLQIAPRAEAGADGYFAVEHPAGAQMRLRESLPGLVTQLEVDQVSVAIFPEAVADRDTADAVGRALESNFRLHAGRPHLQLVVVGTETCDDAVSRATNSAIVFGANGGTICRQDKQHPWVLDADQETRYGLTNLGGVGRAEFIRAGNPLVLLDHPRLGRVAILICQDLNHYACDPGTDQLTAFGPLLVIAPVLSGAVEEGWWAANSACRIALAGACSVVVVNSGVLDDAQRTYGDSRGLPAVSALALAVDLADPPSYFRISPAPDYFRHRVSLLCL